MDQSSGGQGLEGHNHVVARIELQGSFSHGFLGSGGAGWRTPRLSKDTAVAAKANRSGVGLSSSFRERRAEETAP